MGKGTGTYPFQGPDSCWAAFCVGIFWESQAVLQDGLRHLVGVSSIKWPFVEQEFVGCDAQTPPINTPGIALPSDDLWSHVSHAACHARVHAALRIMNGNVEVGDMGMARGVQQNVIWFEVSVIRMRSTRSEVIA